MKKHQLHKVITTFIATVWLVNGLVCKALNLVPRHQQIVAQILGEDYATTFTLLIGISEIVIAIWVLSKFKARLNAITQITIVTIMNIMEFLLVPDLLLWGKVNALFALLFIGLIYFNEFLLKKKLNHNTIK